MAKTKKTETPKEELVEAANIQQESKEQSETDAKVSELESQIQELLDRQEVLTKKLESVEYKGFGYRNGQNIEVSADQFFGLLNTLSHYEGFAERVNSVIDAIDHQFLILRADIKSLDLNARYFTCELLEKHVNNIDEGIAVSGDVLDAEDAKKKIKESK